MLPEPSDPRGRLDLEAVRVVGRLTALGPRRAPHTILAEACADLAVLSWAAELRDGRPPRIDVAPHGWADVVRVLIGDLLAVRPEPDQLAPAATRLTRLRRELP